MSENSTVARSTQNQIPGAFEELEMILEQMAGDFTTLVGRLDPVLRAKDPVPEGAGAVSPKSPVPMVNRLIESSDKARVIRNAIRDVLERIET